MVAGIHAYDGYYLSIAKKNQLGVRQDLLDFFEAKELDQGEWEYHKKVQKGHGRLEVREIWTSTQMNQWFEQEWAAIAQVFQIRKSVKRAGKESEETVYGVMNLPRKRARAKRLLDLHQKHWSIEKRFHYRRDVTLGEGAYQVRLKHAPQT